MDFNYGLEKKNFDRQWAIMRKQYEDAGMSIEVIQAMYEYDWSVFNAARSYQNHTQEIAAPSFEQGEEAYSPLMNKYQEAISITEHYTELKAAVHAMIQRLEYSFTFNPSLLTIPKRKQQVAEILKEAETYIWRIKEEMRCA